MKRLLLCAALLAWSGLASAVVYKWTDAQGKTQYGDRPPDGVHAELVEMLGNHPARPVAPSASAAGNAASPRPVTSRAAPSSPEESQAKREVERDVAANRDKQCVEAQERYRKLIEGRRIYKAGADGERQYLTSEELDSERINSKREVDSVCNGGA